MAALRAAWGPDPVSFSGRFYRIPASQIGPKPVQPGGPPIIIGAFAPAAIERAARIAGGLNPAAVSWDQLEQTIAAFRTAAQNAGRNPETLQVVVRANTELSDRPAADPRAPFSGSAEQIADDLARGRATGLDHVFFDMNYGETPVDDMLRLLERLRVAAA